MAYGLYNRLRFNDYFGSAWDVQISRRDYTGSSTNLTGTGHPLHIRLENSNGKDEPGIRGIVAEINIRATSLTEHDIYFIADNRNFKVDIYKDSILYIGDLYIDPENGSKPILQIYETNLKASTTVGYLRDVEFKQDNGNLYRDKKTLYSCIYDCISHIDSTPKFYEGLDIYGTSNHSASPLTNEYLDPRLYRIDWDTAQNRLLRFGLRPRC